MLGHTIVVNICSCLNIYSGFQDQKSLLSCSSDKHNSIVTNIHSFHGALFKSSNLMKLSIHYSIVLHVIFAINIYSTVRPRYDLALYLSILLLSSSKCFLVLIKPFIQLRKILLDGSLSKTGKFLYSLFSWLRHPSP